MSQDATYPVVWDGGQATFIAADGTRLKTVLHRAPAGASIGVLQSTGGHRIFDVTAVSADTASKDVNLYVGKALTTRVAGTTGNITVAASTWTRALGNYLTEGWRQGDLAAIITPPTLAPAVNEGTLGVVSSLTATVLTFNGTPFSAETLSTDGAMLVRLSPKGRIQPSTPSVAGTPAFPAVSFIGSVQDNSADRVGMNIGADELLLAQVSAAVAALPAWISVDAREGRY